MNQATCPQRDHIARYVLGTLDEQEMEQVADHLAGCSGCQAVANELDSASDPLIEILRSPQPESPHVNEPQCRRALDRLTGLRRKFPWLFQPGTESSSDGEWDLPQIFGEYLVLTRIGGHLGDVYKAFHLELERLVALKMLPRNLLADEAAAERFRREIKAIGRLDHPNIVRAHDAREVGGRRFLVMEFVDGADLAELVRRGSPLRMADACELVRQAAVGLQYVYQHGLVHRDVKPANLMLARDGQVKLLDLGLARFRVHRPAGGEATGPGLAVGTADYMAPEQVSDSHEVDIRADVYSLGCTLYKLLAGRAPFESPDCESTLDKLNAHLKRPVPPIKQLRCEVPDGLAVVVDRMLAKNPAERFDTPDQVAAALAPFATGANLSALLAGPNVEVDSWERDPDPPSPRSNRWFWELIALAGVVLVLVFGGKMIVDWWGPFGNRGVPKAVARRDPAPTVAQPKETPEAAPHGTAEEPSSAESATQSPQTTPEEAKGPKGSGQAATVPLTAGSPQDPAANNADTPTAFSVQVELDHPDGIYHGRPAGPDGQGDLIYVKVGSEQPGYLYLLNQQADGTLVCLFPNVYQPDNKIAPGQQVTVPDPEGDFNLRAGPPYGTEVLVALVTLEPLEPTKFGVASLTDQQFTVVDRDAIERLRAETKQTPNTGTEVQVELTTRPGNQQQSQAPESAPRSSSQSPESAPPPPDEPPESISPAPHKAPEAVHPGSQKQLDPQASEPSLAASRRRGDRPAPAGGA